MWQDDLARWESITTMDGLKTECIQCQRCSLRHTCEGVVFGEGDPHGNLMLVGEAPGKTEDQLGRPFVGAAGQLLNRILQAADIPRDAVFITNTVKCRPPGNRMPSPDETQACLSWLVKQVRLIRPRILVCLGAQATQTILGQSMRVTQVRGRDFYRNGIHIIPTFHPAALLRDASKKRPVWNDFQMIRDLYRKTKETEEET
jgi:DNA polymerase